MLNARKADADRAMLLVIDLQTKLLPRIEDWEVILDTAELLVQGAQLFGLPILATAQYVKGLGPLHERVARPLKAAGIPVSFGRISTFALYTAAAAFLSSTAGGVVPIGKIDGRVIGSGTRGPITRQLAEAYLRLLEDGTESTPVPRVA